MRKQTSPMRNLSLSVSAVLIVFLLSVCPVRLGQAAEAGLTPGKQAPEFELTDLHGKKISLTQFRGRIVLLNFWSTLCAPCVAEMPSLNRLYLGLRDRGFEVLSVAIDNSDKPVREFAEANKVAFPVVVDLEKEVFFDDYAGPSLPATFLIDRNGAIVETVSGGRQWDSPEMKNKILKLLEKR